MAGAFNKISAATALSMKQEPYRNFINSIDSEDTKRTYRESLTHFMRFLGVETYDDLLRFEPTKLEGFIRDFIIHMKEDKKSSPATVSVRLAAVTHFYEMNDVTLHWTRLIKFKGRFRNVIEDQPYTREQIKKLVKAAPLRDKCIITLMACSGMRRGAIPLLRLKEVDRIEKYDILKFHVYKNTVHQNAPSL